MNHAMPDPFLPIYSFGAEPEPTPDPQQAEIEALLAEITSMSTQLVQMEAQIACQKQEITRLEAELQLSNRAYAPILPPAAPHSNLNIEWLSSSLHTRKVKMKHSFDFAQLLAKKDN